MFQTAVPVEQVTVSRSSLLVLTLTSLSTIPASCCEGAPVKIKVSWVNFISNIHLSEQSCFVVMYLEMASSAALTARVALNTGLGRLVAATSS